ncbi:3-deoxy-7-phosphoheptulonate synthase [Elusimicrobiota bacterium]
MPERDPVDSLPDLSVLRRRWPEYADPSAIHDVRVRGVAIGGPGRVVIAGPCAVESLEQTLNIARRVKELGGRLLRGGAYKPRTDPRSFQGLEREGLEILSEVRRRTGLGVVTEVMDPRLVEEVAQHADMLQIGARSMHNYPLLKEVARFRKPVLLKRGFCATLEEWLCAAEYVAEQGNRDIVLCERGTRSSTSWDRVECALELDVVAPLRRATPLPVIADPSHSSERWTQVVDAAKAALAAGFDGLLIETIESEESRSTLRCDSHRGINPDLLAEIMTSASDKE